MLTYQKAKDLIHENKFSEALGILEKLKCNEDETQKEEVLRELVKVKKILNLNSRDDKILLATCLTDRRKFAEAIQLIEEVEMDPTANRRRCLEFKYKALSLVGEIRKAKDCGEQYIEELLTLKKYHLIKAFLPTYLKQGGDSDIAGKHLIRSYIGTGDIQLLEKEMFSDIIRDFVEDNKVDFKTVGFLLEELEKAERRFSRTNLFKSARLVVGFESGLRPGDEWGKKKRIINEIFDGILKNVNDPKYLNVLLEYSKMCKRKRIGEKVVELLLERKSRYGIRRGEEKKLKILRAEIEKWPEDVDKDMSFDNMDMGTDLFKEYNEGSNIFQKIKKLERDIDFLKNTNNQDEVRALLEELRGLDDEHTLVKELNEVIRKEEASRVSSKRMSATSIRDELLEQISRFSKKTKGNSEGNESIERNIKVQIELMDFDVFKKNQTDLVIALMEMGLYYAAMRCLERCEAENSNMGEILNHAYLRIQILSGMGRHHEALDVCKETISNYPLKDLEKINFVYLEGELSRKLKKLAQAVAAFKWVYKVEPEYRLVRQRLKEIEQG